MSSCSPAGDVVQRGTGSTSLLASKIGEIFFYVLINAHPDQLLRYLSNWPLFLAAISAICLGLYKIIKLLSRHPHSQLTPKDLVSPSRDTDLARLEADVIISSLASSLLPAPLGKSAKPDVLLEKESVEVIQDFMVKPKWNNRLEKWRWITRVLGGALWLGVEVASATTTDRRDWRGVVYPVCHIPLALAKLKLMPRLV